MSGPDRGLAPVTLAVTDLATGFGRVLDIVGEPDRVDVADQERETITAVAMKDGAKTELAKNQSRPRYIGLGPDHVYWHNGSLSDANKAVEDRIMRMKKAVPLRDRPRHVPTLIVTS